MSQSSLIKRLTQINLVGLTEKQTGTPHPHKAYSRLINAMLVLIFVVVTHQTPYTNQTNWFVRGRLAYRINKSPQSIFKGNKHHGVVISLIQSSLIKRHTQIKLTGLTGGVKQTGTTRPHKAYSRLINTMVKLSLMQSYIKRLAGIEYTSLQGLYSSWYLFISDGNSEHSVQA